MTYYIRLKGTERYLTYNEAFWGYGQYWYANEFRSKAAARERTNQRKLYLKPGTELELVNANNFEVVDWED